MTIPIEVKKQMFESVIKGDVKTIQKIAKEHQDVLHKGWAGETGPGYLHLAASERQLNVCKALVKLGIDINITDNERSVPLVKAATTGDRATVQWFLENGANADGVPRTIATPLMFAAIEGHLEVTRLLLDADAEINREHLRLPQTALDFAEFYKVKQTGQENVADFLRERGGIRPYTEKHDWRNVPGQLYIEHIERAVGGFVNPIVADRLESETGRSIDFRKVRIPKKYDYQLLFTVGLSDSGFELALCLPSAWPFNRMSMLEPRLNWPLEMIKEISRSQLNGFELKHGDLLSADHSSIASFKETSGIEQWVVALNDDIETEHEGDIKIARTLLIVPVKTKKLAAPGKGGLKLADQKRGAKWEKLSL